MPDARDLPVIAPEDIDSKTKFVVIDGEDGASEDIKLVSFNDVLPSVGAILSTANQYVADAQNALSENQRTVNNFVESAQNSLGSINLLSGSRGTSDKNTQFVGAFEGIPFLNPNGGGSPLIDVGKFTNNQTERNEVLTSLLAAMGRTGDDARYGSEFYVVQTTAGGLGTANPQMPDHKLMFNTYEQILPQTSTFYAWVRVVSGELSVSSYNAWLDGQLQRYPLITDNGWHHIGMQFTQTTGTLFSFPRLYATDDAVVQLALPTINVGAGGNKIIRFPEVEI